MTSRPLAVLAALGALALTWPADGQESAPRLPVRDISFAPDGRLLASVEGDVWMRSSDGRTWTQVTIGPDWDR
ncbi:MAG: hypothetical protein ACT4P7_01400, partial [Gemmatimonadaceae bacterium]